MPNVDLRANILSVATGSGMLDIAVDLAFHTLGWVGARAICIVEKDPGAALTTAERISEVGDIVPSIWDDATTFRGSEWRGIVDCLTAGYPCQPFSLAGRRQGADDPRHLWPHVARIIGECEPALVFLENVPGHLTLGYETVRSELQELGYGVTEILLSALECGAPHERERLYILGYANRLRKQQPYRMFGEIRQRARDNGAHLGVAIGLGRQPGRDNHPGNDGPELSATNAHLADANSLGFTGDALPLEPGPPELQRNAACRGVAPLADSARAGLQNTGDGDASQRSIGGSNTYGRRKNLFPPGFDAAEQWAYVAESNPDQLPTLDETALFHTALREALPQCTTESEFLRVAHGVADRLDHDRPKRIRMAGNGVVTVAAACAFIVLADRLDVVGGAWLDA